MSMFGLKVGHTVSGAEVMECPKCNREGQKRYGASFSVRYLANVPKDTFTLYCEWQDCDFEVTDDIASHSTPLLLQRNGDYQAWKNDRRFSNAERAWYHGAIEVLRERGILDASSLPDPFIDELDRLT